MKAGGLQGGGVPLHCVILHCCDCMVILVFCLFVFSIERKLLSRRIAVKIPRA